MRRAAARRHDSIAPAIHDLQSTIPNPTAFDTAGAQSRLETTVLRNKPQITQPMKKLGILLLLAVVGNATPLLIQAQITETYTFANINRLLPEGDLSGLSDVRTVSSSIANITSVTVGLDIAGEFNGDLYGYLWHSSGTVTNLTVLLNRPGKTASNPFGYADSGLNVTFQDSAPNGDIHLYQTNTIPPAGSPLTGTWQPDGRNVDPATVLDTSPRATALAVFNSLNAAGDWTLFMADMETGATNQLTEWSLTIVGQAYPILTWAAPANIVYGTALGSSQLSATATYNSTNVPGTFTYTPVAGTVLNAGQGQTLSVTFTPADTATFLPITASVTINVSQANPSVSTWPTASAITYGQTLASSALSGGSATPAGSFAFTTPATQPGAGTASQNVTYAPTDATDYNTASSTVSVTVNKANPSVTAWPAASAITYGQTLASSALTGGSATPAGTFAFTTPATQPGAGTAPQNVTYSPTDTADYNTASSTVSVTVNKAATTGVIVSSASAAGPGTNVTFTVTISPVAPGTGTPTGTVNLRTNGSIGGAGTLSGGIAAFTTGALTNGSNRVVAEYAGDGNFAGITNSLVQVIDMPVTPPLTIQRYPTEGAQVKVATILSNCSDADGASLTLTAVSATSANNATITESVGWVFYTPPAGFTGADSFTYTATDAYGISAVGTITVAIEVNIAQSQNLTVALEGSSVVIVGNCIPGYTYYVQFTTTLNPPDWQTIGSVTADSTGAFQYPATTAGFYRTYYP